MVYSVRVAGRPATKVGHMQRYNGHMTALMSLAQDVGVSERTLRRAVSQGTLRGTRPSPRKLELPLSERQFVRRSWGLFTMLRRALRTEHGVRFVLLFGSAARGGDVPGSDVDVLVVLRDAHLERVADLSVKLSEAAGRQVDVVRLQDAEVDPAFLADALRDGRVVVDRDRLWPRLRAREPGLRRRGERQEDRRMRAALEGIDRLLGS
jgi:predicted nucleotidyltransferase